MGGDVTGKDKKEGGVSFYVGRVENQNIYEEGLQIDRRRVSKPAAVREMAPDEVSAVPVLGGGVMVFYDGGIQYFKDLQLIDGRLANRSRRERERDR